MAHEHECPMCGSTRIVLIVQPKYRYRKCKSCEYIWEWEAHNAED